MSAYLTRRTGGTYYFRRAIPRELRSAFGDRREYVVSLRTKNREEAKRLIPALTIAFDDQANGRAPIAAMMLSVAPFDDKTTREGAPLSLLTTFDSYAKEQGLKPGTASEWRAMIGNLIAFIGFDDARKLTVDDLDRWRDHLLATPSRKGTLRDPKTIKGKYLSCLRATLNWAVEKRLLKTNVASNVAVRVPRKVRLRSRDFTSVEATAILTASLAPPPVGLSLKQALARRWVPWLCAYSGARVNEIGQLRGIDIARVDDIWIMSISPEAGTVKGDCARQVPLHPHLVEQGFLTVARAAGNDPIFYHRSAILKPESGNRYYKKVGERLRDWVRNEVGITDANVQPNHGWRHSFKTAMIALQVPERVADAIQGHAPRSVGQSYGSVPLKVMANAIASIPTFEVTSNLQES